ncbi:MAG: 2,4-dihydroxyhept-2-ene-1,7-dioic acid aldolase, partial [Acetobacteraceae bacterium]|nr:2,4-dihydroxyhept-2-ene-1,7-dioic acid aldolase [Acetobacteraceae bacterium]
MAAGHRMNAGAMVMLPMTETRAQAEALVQGCRYRPEGRR